MSITDPHVLKTNALYSRCYPPKTKIIEGVVGTLSDLGLTTDLDDLELLSYALEELDCLDQVFEVHEMPARHLRWFLADRYQTALANMRPVNIAPEDRAFHRNIIEAKKENFDEGRIVVSRGCLLLDGYHHLAAASSLKRPVRFVNLLDPLPEIETSYSFMP